jgi:NAD(P)-dependent dehydrogenase (short-subunit alcohol dehydrogenase family)
LSQYPDLQNKVVLITGAAGNLGRAVTHFFHAEGCQLALFDRDVATFQKAYGDDLHPSWFLLGVDLTLAATVESAVQKVFTRYGALHILVNIAGGYAGGKDTHETPESTWDTQMSINAKSVFLMSGAVVRIMCDNNLSGRIINVGAKPALQGTAGHSAYSASKAAVLRLTESMAAEYRAKGINVNAVIHDRYARQPCRHA